MANGIPPLLDKALTVATKVSLLVEDAQVLQGILHRDPWGLYYDDGSPAVTADSFVSLETKRDWRLPTYPVENGGFATYNKVQVPYDMRLTLARSGDDQALGEFIAVLDNAAESLELVHVVTPTATYLRLNISHYDYRRTAESGRGMLTVDIWLQEIRATATMAFTQVRAPSAADPVNGGTVQAQPATSAQTQSALRQIGTAVKSFFQ